MTMEISTDMDKDQLRDLIRRVLKDAGLWSDSAEELLMLTAAVESNLGTYIRQWGGPALGIFQMEPTTESDIWNNYLRYKRDTAFDVSLSMVGTPEVNQDELEWNLKYAIIMARIHYLRVSEPLPPANDVLGLAQYHKLYYNTPLGKATVEESIRKYNKYVRDA